MNYPNRNNRVELVTTIKDYVVNELLEYNNHNIYYDFSVNSFLSLFIFECDERIKEFSHDNKN